MLQQILNSLLVIKLGEPTVKLFNPTEAINYRNNSSARFRMPILVDKNLWAHQRFVKYDDIDTQFTSPDKMDDFEVSDEFHFLVNDETHVYNCDLDYESRQGKYNMLGS